jgi:Spy/CpxP family protein refolding chaperone
MKNRILILTLAAALGAGGLFALKAHAESTAPRRAPGALLQRAKERLGITDDQAAQIRSVLKDERDNLVKLARAVNDGRTKLRGVIQKDDATEADIRAAAAELGKAQADMAVERHQLFGKLKPILTADQLDTLAEMQDKLDSFIDGAISTFEERLAQ